MLSRAFVATVAVVLLGLLGPAVAQANHTFSVSKSEAAAGDEVEFQISGTQAGESYIVKVDDHEVASGVDSAGNGVTDRFRMPDFGGSNQSVSVEVRIFLLDGEPDHLGPPQTMQYVAAFSGASGDQAAAQPAPAVTVPVRESDPGLEAFPSTPKRDPKPNPPPTENPGPARDPQSPKVDNPTADPTPPSPPTSTGGGSSGSIGSDSAPISVNRAPEVPGPSGPNAPVGSSLAAVLSPLSGLAEPGTTGFPILLILLIVLLAATALTAAGPRLWQRWEPALPWGPTVDDDMRLGALQRASASGAELQQTIAQRRASRSSGRPHLKT